MHQFELVIALRYAKPGAGKGTAGLLSGLSLIGLALSVFGLIVVMSIMNGFERELQSRMLTLVPHAKIQSNSIDDNEWSEIASTLRSVPEITSVAPYGEGSVVLNADGQVAVARLAGVDVDLESHFSKLSSLVVAGNYYQLSTPFSIAIGAGLARRLGLTIGDRLTVIQPRIQITPFGPVTREKQLRIVAVFESGTELDSSLAFASLQTSKKILAKSQVLDGLKINVKKPYADHSYIEKTLMETAVHIRDEFQFRSWQEENAALYSAVVMEKLMIFVLLLCIVAVASFSIVAIVLMSVIDKKTDIAILRTMGASAQQIRQVFLLQGVIIGTLGTLTGAVLAILVAPQVGEIFSVLESALGFQLFDPNVYYIAHLPSDLRLPDVLIVTVVAIAISILVSTFPASRASHVDPVVALAVLN